MAEKKNGITFKIVGLIVSIVVVLAIFIGAVSSVSINMANNTISIGALKEDIQRHENLISDNAIILRQHAQLLAILDQHESSLDILTDFMTQGGRFTEADGHLLENKLQAVEKQLQHYEVLERELSWIKDSMRRLETDMARRFDSLQKKLDTHRKNDVD
jgi:hypothetical protein